MKTNTKIILGVAAVVVVVAVALLSSNTKLFRGSLTPATRPAEPIPGVTHPVLAWVEPASTVLTTGSQIPVARFTLGASATDPDRSSEAAFSEATLAVSSLNFENFGTAGLTNFSLRDITMNEYRATHANSSNFSGKATGGSMSPLSFRQGETRTFQIYADVTTSGPKQTVQFAFNSETSVVWKGSDGTRSTLFELRSSDVSDRLVGATTGSDTVGPTITSVTVADIPSEGPLDLSRIINAGDTIRITFSERIDPTSINPGLTYGAGVLSVGSTTTGGLSAYTSFDGWRLLPLGSTTKAVSITGIAKLCTSPGFCGGDVLDTLPLIGTDGFRGDSITVQNYLDETGTILTVVVENVPSFARLRAPDRLSVGLSRASIVRDAAGNYMESRPIPSVTGSF